MRVARSGVAVASSTKIAADAGAAVARAGGNAVDAAIAAAWVGAVAEPGICAPGCGGFATIWGPEYEPVTIDGYIEMPGRGLSADRFGKETRLVRLDYGGGVSMHVGHGSVGTPGGPAALAMASERYGRVPWSTALEPAIELARDGFDLSPPARHYLEFSGTKVFGWHPDSRKALHHADGSLFKVGERVLIEHLADSLERLARYGVADFYTGEIGHTIASDMADNGGLITVEDLAQYQPVVREALVGPVGDWIVATNPPPAIGGVILGAMLRLVGERPSDPWSRDDVERFVEVQKSVLGYRRDHVDMREDIATAIAEMQAAFRSPSTVHTSSVDSDGLACSITLSAGYGSGVMVPGTGMWLNNCLGEIELNRRGLHTWPAGARLVSNMSPTVARDATGRVLSIGSPGADRITTAILQVFANHANAGMSLAESITHPRLHLEMTEDGPQMVTEPGIPTDLGDVPWRTMPNLSMYFGGVGVAEWSPASGLAAEADPRRSGGTAVVETGD
ncbi:MAG: gamma-glutamyltransferase [Gemmatimonadota bacterium]